MIYSSSVAVRAILAVNRLLSAAMTSAWTTTLRHQHALPPQEEDCSADDTCSSREKPSAPDDQLIH
jgi:hypothetical protein